jgi:hypothetical protein
MITMRIGERVRWYLMSMGGAADTHTPHWHGNNTVVAGMRTDTVPLFPGTMAVADMVPDNVGVWLFHCHVNEHITAGMLTRYQVVSDVATTTAAVATRPPATAMPVPTGAVPAGGGGIADSPPSLPAAVAVSVVLVAATRRRLRHRRRGSR